MIFRRRREKRSSTTGAGQSSPDALASEREFLQQSIEDLEREHASGEVDEADFAILFARYRDRLLEVEAALADLRDRCATRFPAIGRRLVRAPRRRTRRPRADGECVGGSEAGVCGWWSGPARRRVSSWRRRCWRHRSRAFAFPASRRRAR